MHCKRTEPLHRLSASLLSALLIATMALVVAPAAASDAKVEKDVKELQKKAIEEDFLGTDYDGAIKKLKWAITRCGSDKCSPALKGAIHRDLGAMLILNKKDDEGKASFAEALKLDSSLQLDSSYKSGPLEAAWDEVKKGAGGGGASSASSTVAAGATKDTESTELTHTAVTEQRKHTPIPVYVEYSGDGVAKVTAKYRVGSSGEFKAIDLAKVGKGWGGLIPCDATQGSSVQYYVVARNGSNEAIATTGEKKHPHEVAIKSEISGDAPHLPGLQAPPQCGGDTAESPAASEAPDCPPGMPGCESKKLESEPCDEDAECKSGTCTSGKCTAPTESGKADGEDCEISTECSSNSCNAGKCGGGSTSKFKRVWIGAGVAIDDDFLKSNGNVCGITQYICFNSGTTTTAPVFVPSAQNPTETGTSPVHGTSAYGGTRLLASFDYALSRNFLLGARVGFLIGAYNGPSGQSNQLLPAPLHLEARATYVVGKDGIAAPGLAPVFVAGAGISQFGATVRTGNYGYLGSTTPLAGSGAVDAWYLSGGGFITGGGGVRYGFSDSVALMAIARATATFGGNAGFMFLWDPELAIQVGF